MISSNAKAYFSISSKTRFRLQAGRPQSEADDMRLWTIHPRYLDRMGLLAAWREGLLAKKVLGGGTKGYRNHPQLARFSRSGFPIDLIDVYLGCVADEASRRGYDFDRSKIGPIPKREKIAVQKGQIAYEVWLLGEKLAIRDPGRLPALRADNPPALNDAFRAQPGGIEPWERVLQSWSGRNPA